MMWGLSASDVNCASVPDLHVQGVSLARCERLSERRWYSKKFSSRLIPMAVCPTARRQASHADLSLFSGKNMTCKNWCPRVSSASFLFLPSAVLLQWTIPALQQCRLSQEKLLLEKLAKLFKSEPENMKAASWTCSWKGWTANAEL